MARIVYAHEVVKPAKRRGRASPVTTRKRATPRTSRAMPKGRPAGVPLVTSVTVPRIVRTVLPITAAQLEVELRRVGRPASARTMRSHICSGTAEIAVESRILVDGWLVRWDEVYPSQNELMRKYANHHAYGRLIAKWEGIFQAAMLQGKIPKAKGRRRLTITRFVRDQKYRLDRGNLVGGGKPFLDAAVRAGLIRNDREEDVDDQYRQAIDPDERVEITVEDL